MSVTLSAGVRKALSSLQSTSAAAQGTQFRLATGKKVNSALDNPASFFTAAGLSNRASDLTRLLDNMGQAVKTLEAADKGIKAINKLVENAQSLAKQAEAAGADSTASRAQVSGSFSAASMSDGDSVTINLNGTEQTITFTSADATGSAFATKLNAATGISASVSGSSLVIESESTGSNQSITIVRASSAGVLTRLGVSAGATDNGTDLVTKRADLARDFDAIRQQIDQLAADSGYNGVNLLKGDSLSVQFNENNTSKLGISGNDNTSSGLSISAAANSWAQNTDVATATSALKSAADTLRSRASTFGANLSVVQNRQDFTKGMVSTLTEGSDALTAADTNEEAANLLALQTRTQLSQTALQLSSQADQGVLRLF